MTLRFNLVITFSVLFTLLINGCLSRDQRYNPSSDFLLHENSGVISDGKRDYASQFPTLRTPSTQFTQSSTNGILISTAKPQSGKRDYVAPQRSTNTLSTSTTARSTPNLYNPSSPNSGTTSAKRDYVNPHFPTLKPVGFTSSPSLSDTKQTTGKVKDLINFYDNKAQNGPVSPQKPSYSSILRRPDSNTGTSGTTTNAQTTSPAKPTSFGSVVSGSTKPISLPSTKPTWSSDPNKPVTTNNVSTKKPIVLPSSIASNTISQATNPNGISDIDLQTLSEELLRKDTNNAAKYVTVNYQEKTTSQSKDDKAPLPLLTIAPDVWNIPTVQKFVPLLDNYERDTLVNEHVTAQERNEENAFMDAIMSTSVIRHLMNFLKEKGYVTPDPKQQRDFLKQIWFGMYSRGKGKISSSGFEHVFVSELKDGEVSGLHNWIYFSREEAANRINYLGYLKYSQFDDKGAILKMHFNQQGVDKPVDSMFIGTSPEMEMALYTLCYVTRVDQDCNLKLGTKDVNINTYNYRYRSKNYIGSAYPQI